MLTPWGRVLTRTAGLSALHSLPAYKAVIPVGQSIPRGLATATVPKKAANSRPTATKKTTTTVIKTVKAPVKKTTSTSTTKKAAPKTATAAQKRNASTIAVNTAKKPLTPEQQKKRAEQENNRAEREQERAEKRKLKAEKEKKKDQIKSLLEKALDPPRTSTGSTWVCFLKEKFEPFKGSGEGVAAILKREHTNWSNEYKNLTPAQLEALQGRVASTKGTKQQNLADWIKQYTPAQIYQANVARAALRSIQAKSDPVPRGLSKKFPSINDDRYPTRGRSANVLYVQEKFATLPKEKKFESLAPLMKEFTALPETEKKKWYELSAKDHVRFRNELKSIGIEPPPVRVRARA